MYLFFRGGEEGTFEFFSEVVMIIQRQESRTVTTVWLKCSDMEDDTVGVNLIHFLKKTLLFSIAVFPFMRTLNLIAL